MTTPPRPRHPAPRLVSPWYLYAFVVVQFVCVAALVVEALGSLRFVLRLIPFGMSIAYLVLLPARGPSNPVRPWAAAGLAIMTIAMAHPETNSLLAGAAQVGLALAVWGPIFWAGRIAITPDVFRKLLIILWLLNSASAAVGVLQVYDPGRFAPDPTFVKQMLGEFADGLKVRLDDGTEVFRPMGLSDSPGGAALAANSAIVIGVGVALTNRGSVIKLAVVASAVVSAFSLYICQVRSLFLLTVISLLAYSVVMAYRGLIARALALIGALIGVGVLGFLWATSIGSDAVTSRFATLFEASAGDVYYQNRGHFIEDTVEVLIPEYPLGAGLGRWGMMYSYFGNPNNPSSPPLWAETTFTGWVFDGGVPLLLTGYGAMLAGFLAVVRLMGRGTSPVLADSAAVVAAITVAAFATTLSAHVFVAQSGMMYLLLTAALLTAARQTDSRRRGAG